MLFAQLRKAKESYGSNKMFEMAVVGGVIVKFCV